MCVNQPAAIIISARIELARSGVHRPRRPRRTFVFSAASREREQQEDSRAPHEAHPMIRLRTVRPLGFVLLLAISACTSRTRIDATDAGTSGQQAATSTKTAVEFGDRGIAL